MLPDKAMGIPEVRQKGQVQTGPCSMLLSMLVTGRAASCGMAMQPSVPAAMQLAIGGRLVRGYVASVQQPPTSEELEPQEQ